MLIRMLLSYAFAITFSAQANAQERPAKPIHNFREPGATPKDRFAAFANVPTVAGCAIAAAADFSMDIWRGLFAPAKSNLQQWEEAERDNAITAE